MAEALSVFDYFEVVLPSILRWKGPAASALGINVLFIVNGKGGGTWTIRLRPPTAGVVSGSEWKADLQIKITADEMANILVGKFDANKAIAEGNVELSGDLRCLRRIAFLFQMGGHEAEIRAGRV
ncbi:MAG: hypothetical protein CMH60_01815 [Myxococcales bacterium]|nr:hypothetical protein [Myxococcales bacterium]|tara:strand:- start:546 stop:920 length:375 start_codon:yes stop_codon:yes gene_type:complete